MYPWAFRDVCQESGTSPSNRWAYRTSWRWNWSLFARVTASSLFQETVASALRVGELSSVACACVIRGFWELSANAMKRALC